MNIFCTDVGDRNVLERMEKCGYMLGGEQSGHMIFRRYATTGDGQLAALQLLQLIHRSGKTASELTGVCARYPQVLINVPVNSKEAKESIMASGVLRAAVKEEEEALRGMGRILVRPSGTEALIRVMVEAKEAEQAECCAEKLAELIKSL